MQVYERFLAGIRSYALARALTQLGSWAGTVYVVRKLDSHAFGLFGIALVVYNYLSMVYDGTLTETLVQRYPAESERRSVFTLLLVIGAATTLLMAGAATLAASAVSEPRVAPLIRGLSVALALTSLSVLPNARLIRSMEFGTLAIISGVQSVTTTVVTVGLAFAGEGAWSLAVGMVTGIAIRAILLNVVSWSLVLPTARIAGALPYVRFGGILLADNLLWRWYVSLDTLLLGRWAGAASLGYYSLAQQLADMPLEKITTVVNDVSLPAYAELSRDPRRAARLMLETIRTHATVGFPIFWGLAAVAHTAVPLLFGVKWANSIFPLEALCLVAPLRLIGSIETPAMTGLGCPSVLLRTKLIIVPCMTCALAVGAWYGSIDGAALAWLLAFPLCYGTAFRFVLRAAGLPYRQVLQAIRGPLLAAALMAASVFAWDSATLALGLLPVPRLCAGIAVGAASYPMLLRLIDPGAYSLARSRIGRFLGLGRPQ